MPYEHVTAYRIESNREIYQLIESIKFHINDITITEYSERPKAPIGLRTSRKCFWPFSLYQISPKRGHFKHFARFCNVALSNQDRAGPVKSRHLLGLCELALHHLHMCSLVIIFFKCNQDGWDTNLWKWKGITVFNACFLFNIYPIKSYTLLWGYFCDV